MDYSITSLSDVDDDEMDSQSIASISSVDETDSLQLGDMVTVTTRNCCDIAKALRNNTHVCTLHILLAGRFSDSGTDSDWQDLCEAAQSLPCLEKVVLKLEYSSSMDYVRMGLLLKHTRQIKELEVNSAAGAFFKLRSPFLANLAEGITDHTALESITLPQMHEIESLALFALTFSTIPNLKRLAFEGNGLSELVKVKPFFLERLLSLSSLEELVLEYFEFGDEHSEACRQGLSSRQSSSLRRLVVHACDMTMACAASLLQGVGNHSNLRDLRLEKIAITDDGSEFAHLLDPLSQNESVKVLALSFYFEEGQQWPSFSFLQENTSIEHLEINDRENRILAGGESFPSLCRSLWTNHSLETLKFQWCDFGDDNVDALVELIRNNTGLKHLAICHHHISVARLADFVPALAQNESLKSLDISPSSKGGTAGVTEFAKHVASASMAKFVEGILSVSRLKKIRVGRCKPVHMEPLIAIMAKNFCVEDIKFYLEYTSTEKAVEDKLNVIGTLNKFGRRYLVERGPECKVAGVKLLSAVSDNLDCLFYHLRENPGLCERAEGGTQVMTAISSSNVGGDVVPLTNRCRMSLHGIMVTAFEIFVRLLGTSPLRS